MNHLAHLFLAGSDPDSIVGNLAGDFVKGPLGTRFEPAIREGIAMHRRIDAYTDAHPSVAAFRRVLIPEHGHYARIICDVFFDHFLANDFERYAGEPLEAFVARVTGVLDANAHRLPERLAQVWPRMRDGGWLLSYGAIDGIHTALFYLSKRLARPHALERATRHLVDSRAELRRRFDDFFPDVVAFARGYHRQT